MSRAIKVITGLTVVIIFLLGWSVKRYNLSYGDSIYEKSIMFGCLRKNKPETTLKERKENCECLVGNLILKYDKESLKNDLDEVLLNEVEMIKNCFKTPDETILKNESTDTSKQYKKLGLRHIYTNNQTQDIEIYINKDQDTFVNQVKTFKNGVIDHLVSQYYELKIERANDSIFKGEVWFYSPYDTTPSHRIKERSVSLFYLQQEGDSIVFKEIKTDTNYIKFAYRDFENHSFVGYISDLRFITVANSDSALIVDHTKFTLDSELSTNNPYIELLDNLDLH